MTVPKRIDELLMRLALVEASRGLGLTSPNPAVGAILAKGTRVVAKGWHRRSGNPHAEVEAFRDATRMGTSLQGATLYVTLEPCSTHGRTPPCVEAILRAGIKRVVIGTIDPNPKHAGRGCAILRQANVDVSVGVLEDDCRTLNESWNHWIVRREPFVVLKAAMTLDGKIATRTGQSKWITGPQSRAAAMQLRRESDAILVGINTVLADDPALTVRGGGSSFKSKRWLKVVLDAEARTPVDARLFENTDRESALIVVSPGAPENRCRLLEKKANVWRVPQGAGGLRLGPILRRLAREREIVQLLVEGGGEVHASFLRHRHAHRIAFFYAPIVFGGRDARKAVGGPGLIAGPTGLRLSQPLWSRLGRDLLLTASLT